MFLGSAVSGSAFYINSGLNIADTQTKRGGDSQSDILEDNENLDIYADWQPEMGSDHWSGHYETSFAGGAGIESDPYLISTPGQLAYLSYLVNYFSTNSQYTSLYYKQTADIDLSAYYWDAIGNATNKFSGHYDGGGYIISGLYTQSNSGDSGMRIGLFGCVEGTYNQYAEVHDVGIVDSVILGVGNVGSIAGEARYANIYNCYSFAEIETTSRTAGTGGIIGELSSSSKVYNCYNAGAITSNGYVGGVVGEDRSSTIQNCYNLGKVDGDITGGVIGDSYGNVFNCYNLGYVAGSQNGGVVGYKRGGKLYNCVNLGSMYSVFNSAGAICYSNGATIRNCYWGGECTVTSGYRSNSGTFSNCGTCTSDNAKDINWYTNTSIWYNSTPPSTEQVESYLWNFDIVWMINPSENDGYPILQMQTKNYNISFNSNGGLGNMESVEVEVNASVTLPSCTFTRTGYEFAGWALSSTGVVVYSDEQTITPTASMTLYAVWRVEVYTITLDWQGATGNGWEVIYYKYGGYMLFDSEACTTGIDGSALARKTRPGYSFASFTTNADGSGTVMFQNSEYLNLNTIVADDIWYAQWTPNVVAKYDSAGDYWYIENGKIPQTKVTDSGLISSLNSATTNGGNYYIAGQTLTAKMYNGTEYCKWNNNWYEVEPIRWRLDASSSQKDGYGTTTDTNAVLAEIVFVGQYSSTYLGSGAGYSTTAVEEFKKNGIDEKYLVDYQNEAYNFGNGTTMYNLYKDYTNMFVASESEIKSVSTTTAIEFSDLAKDIIKSYGGTNVYFTRDLGSNYNNITCINTVGKETQCFATNFRGVQFTIRFTEYACVD